METVSAVRGRGQHAVRTQRQTGGWLGLSCEAREAQKEGGPRDQAYQRPRLPSFAIRASVSGFLAP